MASKDIEEFLKTSRELTRFDQERVELFESLIKHKGFVLYLELLGEMIELKGSEILAPARSMDGALNLEFVKGAMNGLILARDLPSITIAHMKGSDPADEENVT